MQLCSPKGGGALQKPSLIGYQDEKEQQVRLSLEIERNDTRHVSTVRHDKGWRMDALLGSAD